MLKTVVSALLPIILTLALGFFAAWHKDFKADQASVLDRMVMLCALPMSLFAGMVTTKRGQHKQAQQTMAPACSSAMCRRS
jgi:malonate transporter